MWTNLKKDEVTVSDSQQVKMTPKPVPQIDYAYIFQKLSKINQVVLQTLLLITIICSMSYISTVVAPRSHIISS